MYIHVTYITGLGDIKFQLSTNRTQTEIIDLFVVVSLQNE